MTRLTVVSDTHLSAADGYADRNWDAVIRHLEATTPDLVLHGGDISADGHATRAGLAYARAQLDRIPVPWRAVPGNHDLGDPEPEWTITRERRARYEDVFGDRFWAIEIDGWQIVGLDAQALGSGHPDDASWWSWTAEQLGTGRPTIVVLHRPISPTAPVELDVGRRYLNEPHRSRFLRLIDEGGTVRAVVTGHAHQYRSQVIDGINRIWVPSTWALVSDDLQPVIGEKALGVVEIELVGRGAEATHRARLVRPEGMTDHVHRGRDAHQRYRVGPVASTTGAPGRARGGPGRRALRPRSP